MIIREGNSLFLKSLNTALIAQSGNIGIIPVTADHHHVLMAQLQQTINGHCRCQRIIRGNAGQIGKGQLRRGTGHQHAGNMDLVEMFLKMFLVTPQEQDTLGLFLPAQPQRTTHLILSFINIIHDQGILGICYLGLDGNQQRVEQFIGFAFTNHQQGIALLLF